MASAVVIPVDVQGFPGRIGVDAHAAGGTNEKLPGARGAEIGIGGVRPDIGAVVKGLGTVSRGEGKDPIGGVAIAARQHGL
jgi:hypothetical protein